MGKGFKLWAWLITVLATVGTLNWGIVAINILRGKMVDLGGFDLVLSWLPNIVAGIVFLLVGIVGVLLIPTVLAMTLGKKR